MKTSTSKIFVAIAAVVAIFGFIVALSRLVDTFTNGLDYTVLSESIMYIITFALLVVYNLRIFRNSKVTFRVLIISYCLMILVTGFIFPHVAAFGIAKWLMLLSAIVYGALVHFDGQWRDVRMSAIDIAVAFAGELAICLITLLWKDPMMEEIMEQPGFIDSAALFLRPIICLAIGASYLKRMYDKAKEAKQ